MQDQLDALPPLTYETCYVQFSPEESSMYDEMKEKAKALLTTCVNNPDPRDCLLLPELKASIEKLRKMCVHWPMWLEFTDVSNHPYLLQQLTSTLQDHEYLCSICLEPLSRVALITSCVHIFCGDCLVQWLDTCTSTTRTCPVCRTRLSDQNMFLDNSKIVQSSKIKKLIQLLTEFKNQNPSSKTVVFVFFTEMSGIIEEKLQREGFTVCVPGGWKNHREVLEEFRVSGAGKVLLLTYADLLFHFDNLIKDTTSRLYILDATTKAVEESMLKYIPWVEEKAVRLIVEHTIEDRIILLEQPAEERKKYHFSGLHIDQPKDIHFILEQ